MIEQIPKSTDDSRIREARIVKAAVICGRYVFTGWRHSGIIVYINDQFGLRTIQEDQGFVDQFGTFYNRYRSARIALRARQIGRLPHVLTSEDLWDVDGKPRENSLPYNPMGDKK